MQESKIRFGNLSPNDQARLCAVYGPQPENGYASRRIAYVRELNDYEAWFFGNSNFLSPGFLTQTLYKLTGSLSPLSFTRALRDLDKQADVLRTNYCDMGDRVLAVICEQRNNVELIFYNNLQGREPAAIDAALHKSAAALHYPFDVERSGLLRIIVFHTGVDEYAVLVTAAQILMDRFDIRTVFRAALGHSEGVGRKAPLFGRSAQMEAKMREYWKRLLASSPSPAPLPWVLENVPPHPYKQKMCRAVLPGWLFSDLLAVAKDNRLMLMAILAAAWGLLLQTEMQRKDVCFCLIVPNRGSQENNAWHPFRMVPVRQQILDREETVAELVKRQFQQLLVSKPYASFDWKSFGDFLGGGKPFDHFLDFCDYLSEDKPYSDQDATPDGKVVFQQSWDAQSMKLSLYFRRTAASASVTLLYDEPSFAKGAGERIAQCYLLALEQMRADPGQSLASFQERLLERFRAETKLSTAYREEEQARLQHAVSSIRLLQGMDVGTTRAFMQAGTLRTYFEGDRVEDMGRDLLFVVEGRLARSIQDLEGWYCTLSIAKEGAWLNENMMLEKPNAALAAEVRSERATILAISKKDMQTILSQYPGLWQNITDYVIAQLENYQRLWTQS